MSCKPAFVPSLFHGSRLAIRREPFRARAMLQNDQPIKTVQQAWAEQRPAFWAAQQAGVVQLSGFSIYEPREPARAAAARRKKGARRRERASSRRAEPAFKLWENTVFESETDSEEERETAAWLANRRRRDYYERYFPNDRVQSSEDGWITITREQALARMFPEAAAPSQRENTKKSRKHKRRPQRQAEPSTPAERVHGSEQHADRTERAEPPRFLPDDPVPEKPQQAQVIKDSENLTSTLSLAHSPLAPAAPTQTVTKPRKRKPRPRRHAELTAPPESTHGEVQHANEPDNDELPERNQVMTLSSYAHVNEAIVNMNSAQVLEYVKAVLAPACKDPRDTQKQAAGASETAQEKRKTAPLTIPSEPTQPAMPTPTY